MPKVPKSPSHPDPHAGAPASPGTAGGTPPPAPPKAAAAAAGASAGVSAPPPVVGMAAPVSTSATATGAAAAPATVVAAGKATGTAAAPAPAAAQAGGATTGTAATASTASPTAARPFKSAFAAAPPQPLLSALSNVFQDEELAANIACMLMERAGQTQSDCQEKVLTRLADIFCGKADEVAEPVPCRAAVIIKLRAEHGSPSLEGIKLSIMSKEQLNLDDPGRHSFFDCRSIRANEREVRFSGLPTGAYLLQVFLPGGLRLTNVRSLHPADPEGSSLNGPFFPIPVVAPHDTTVLLEIAQEPKPVQIFVFEDRNGTGKPAGQPPIRCASLHLMKGDKPIACLTTNEYGYAEETPGTPLSLDPGIYSVIPAVEVRIKDGPIYKPVQEGPIVFVVSSELMVITVAYTSLSTCTMILTPRIEGQNGTELTLADKIHIAVFRTDFSLVYTATSAGGQPVTLAGLPAGAPILIVVKCTPSLELIAPRPGFVRVQVPAGTVQPFNDLIHARLPGNQVSNTTMVSGQVTDESGNPVVHSLIEVVDTVTHKLLNVTYTDRGGEYAFQTREDPNRLAFRLPSTPERIKQAPAQALSAAAQAVPVLESPVAVGAAG